MPSTVPITYPSVTTTTPSPAFLKGDLHLVSADGVEFVVDSRKLSAER